MRTNFRKVIKDLQRSGFTNALLAHECGCSQTYIGQLAKGYRKQPGYDIGRRMVELLNEQPAGKNGQ